MLIFIIRFKNHMIGQIIYEYKPFTVWYSRLIEKSEMGNSRRNLVNIQCSNMRPLP